MTDNGLQADILPLDEAGSVRSAGIEPIPSPLPLDRRSPQSQPKSTPPHSPPPYVLSDAADELGEDLHPEADNHYIDVDGASSRGSTPTTLSDYMSSDQNVFEHDIVKNGGGCATGPTGEIARPRKARQSCLGIEEMGQTLKCAGARQRKATDLDEPLMKKPRCATLEDLEPGPKCHTPTQLAAIEATTGIEPLHRSPTPHEVNPQSQMPQGEEAIPAACTLAHCRVSVMLPYMIQAKLQSVDSSLVQPASRGARPCNTGGEDLDCNDDNANDAKSLSEGSDAAENLLLPTSSHLVFSNACHQLLNLLPPCHLRHMHIWYSPFPAFSSS
eukprot:GGOE01022835.1.p1 GENE.GGOE01022835.1~~GGOE01022835.1.p1  ORF type:complete len:329 (-),score=23.54 GGOE01022835.1:176-1162(-)